MSTFRELETPVQESHLKISKLEDIEKVIIQQEMNVGASEVVVGKWQMKTTQSKRNQMHKASGCCGIRLKS